MPAIIADYAKFWVDCFLRGLTAGEGVFLIIEVICAVVWVVYRKKGEAIHNRLGREERIKAVGKWTFIFVLLFSTFIVAPNIKFKESESAMMSATNSVSLLLSQNHKLNHEKDQNELEIKLLQSTVDNKNIPNPKIALDVSPQAYPNGDNILAAGHFAVTNDEPMSRLSLNAVVVSGNGKLIRIDSDSEPQGISKSTSDKSANYTAYTFHRNGDFYCIVSDPCTIKITSPLLEDQIMLNLTRTNIAVSHVRY